MIFAPFNALAQELISAIQEAALSAATILARERDGHVAASAIESLNSQNGLTVEFIVAALYTRYADAIAAHFSPKRQLEVMCYDCWVIPENRRWPQPTRNEAPVAPPGYDSAMGWSIESSAELLRILSRASEIATGHQRLASIRDLLSALTQDPAAASRLKSQWGVSLKED